MIVFAIAKDYVWQGRTTHQLKVGEVIRTCQLKVGRGCVLPATPVVLAILPNLPNIFAKLRKNGDAKWTPNFSDLTIHPHSSHCCEMHHTPLYCYKGYILRHLSLSAYGPHG